MEAIEQVELFDNLFYVFLGFAIIGLILAVFFFFYFDIPTVFSLITGRGKKRALERMREQSEKGKSLRDKGSSSSQLKASASRITESGNLRTTAVSSAEVLSPETEDGQTQPLSDISDEILLEEKAGTSVLNQRMNVERNVGATENLKDRETLPPVSGLNFTITESVTFVHTEETI